MRRSKPRFYTRDGFFYFRNKFDELVKSRNFIEFVIPANPGSSPGRAPESSYFKMFWTPAFSGVTLQETFYETIKFTLYGIGVRSVLRIEKEENSDAKLTKVRKRLNL